MDLLQVVFNFLSVVFALCAFYIFKGYWPKYFEAKGTNQATKEDIGEITEIVENIKSDLLLQNEFLKAHLSFQNQHKLNVKSAEREALFDFNKRASAWIYSLIRFTFSGYNIENYKEIKLMRIEFSKRQYECDLAEAHLALFLREKGFFELKRDLTISIIKLGGIVEKAIHNVYYRYSKCEFDLQLDRNDVRQQAIHRTLLYEDLKPLMDAHRTESTEQYRVVCELHSKMTELINKRLKQLEDDLT